MPNFKFYYHYRDGANYKNHSCIIFNNPNNLLLADVELIIQQKLIEDTWFYADKWNLPDLHFDKWDNEIDHTWHEFESIELTDDVGQQDIEDFLKAIMS